MISCMHRCFIPHSLCLAPPCLRMNASQWATYLTRGLGAPAASAGTVARVVLPQELYPLHYALEIAPDLANLVFAGTVAIAVLVKQKTNRVTLHSRDLVVEAASFDASNSAVQIAYNLSDHTVLLTFESDMLPGEGSLVIRYRGVLNGDMAGFYKSSYTDADGVKRTMANTQFESLDARRALPCWDEPAVKATFTVTLVVPAALTALSNMPEEHCQLLPGAKKRVQFVRSPKMSTYLLAFAVGEFDSIQGVTGNGVAIRVFSPPGRAHEGRFSLDCAIKCLDFYDSFFGVPYPLPKLDMLCCTEFAMGAMENWGLVTYREVDLMIDEKAASSARKQRVAIVVAHELAHQWFGNLVTMEWWDDLWLNEGFASFMEHKTLAAIAPEYDIWEQYTTDTMAAALRLDALRSSHPIQVPIARAEEVEQVFDAISYCKGSAVVRMAEGVLGEELFKEGLRLYMRTHAYGNTCTADLWAAWSAVSGVDVAGLMASWTRQMGYPFLRVVDEQWADDKVQITLEQAWFLADGSVSPDDADKVWSIPLLFATSESSSEKAVIMSAKRQTFTVPLAGAEDYLKVNAGQQALVRVAHSAEMLRRLQPCVQSKGLGAVDRAALLLDAYALSKAGCQEPEHVVLLLRAFGREDSFCVWGAIAGVISGLHVLLEAAAGTSDAAALALANYTAYCGHLVKRALLLVGWDAREDDGHTTKLLRATVIGLLDTFCSADAEVVAEARRRYAAHWTDPSHKVLPGDFKTTVFRIVLKNGGVQEYEELLKSYYATEDNGEKKFVLSALGAASTVALKLRTLDWAVKSGEVKMQDFFYCIGSVAASGEGCKLAWGYFKENFAYLKSKLSKASASLMDATVGSSVGRFCTLEAAAEIEAFFIANPLKNSERRISQILESMRSNGAMLNRLLDSALVKPEFWVLPEEILDAAQYVKA